MSVSDKISKYLPMQEHFWEKKNAMKRIYILCAWNCRQIFRSSGRVEKFNIRVIIFQKLIFYKFNSFSYEILENNTKEKV